MQFTAACERDSESARNEYRNERLGHLSPPYSRWETICDAYANQQHCNLMKPYECVGGDLFNDLLRGNNNDDLESSRLAEDRYQTRDAPLSTMILGASLII